MAPIYNPSTEMFAGMFQSTAQPAIKQEFQVGQVFGQLVQLTKATKSNGHTMELL